MNNREAERCEKIKWNRVFVVMALIVVVFGTADFAKRGLSNHTNSNIISGPGIHRNHPHPGEEENMNPLGNDSNSEETPEGPTKLGEFERSATKEQLNDGLLAVYTANSPAKNKSIDNMVNLRDSESIYYSLCADDSDIYLNSEAAEAFEDMMHDYNYATGISDFMVYGTTSGYKGEGSLCPESFPDSPSGYTVDLALNGYFGEISYDGEDAQGWVVENCSNYGFIVRYPKGKSESTGHDYCPWHLRYVGKEHAAVMKQNNLSLEEYVNFLKGYTYDNPLVFNSDLYEYTVYTFTSMGDTTAFIVPGSGSYTVSGDNNNTYIVTYRDNK